MLGNEYAAVISYKAGDYKGINIKKGKRLHVYLHGEIRRFVAFY